VTHSRAKAQRPAMSADLRRRATMRDIGVLFGFKVIALALLWFLFFSDSHRPRADATAAARVLGVAAGDPGNTPSALETLR